MADKRPTKQSSGTRSSPSRKPPKPDQPAELHQKRAVEIVAGRHYTVVVPSSIAPAELLRWRFYKKVRAILNPFGNRTLGPLLHIDSENPTLVPSLVATSEFGSAERGDPALPSHGFLLADDPFQGGLLAGHVAHRSTGDEDQNDDDEAIWSAASDAMGRVSAAAGELETKSARLFAKFQAMMGESDGFR